MKRRKSTKERKDEMLRIRVTATQKEMFTSAATRCGLTTSSWVVERAVIAASAEARNQP